MSGRYWDEAGRCVRCGEQGNKYQACGRCFGALRGGEHAAQQMAVDTYAAVKKERDELKAQLERSVVAGEKLREQLATSAPYSMGDVSGMKDRHEKEMEEANVRIAWLERELKLEKAKNARKRGL